MIFANYRFYKSYIVGNLTKMSINEPLNFGKYKGLTIKEVYQGTNFLNKDLIKGYLLEKIATADSTILSEHILVDIMDFEISDTLIRVTPCVEDLFGNWTKNIENLFRNGNSWADRLIGNLSLDEYNIKKHSLNKEKIELADGNPDYIDWCINNVGFFFITPEELLELQNLEVYIFAGIEVKHKIEDIYEYKPRINVIKHEFKEKSVNLNNTKFESKMNHGDDYQQKDFSNGRTFEKYNGTYAQDVEGWSDQDIDDAFGGEPDAYWNID